MTARLDQCFSTACPSVGTTSTIPTPVTPVDTDTPVPTPSPTNTFTPVPPTPVPTPTYDVAGCAKCVADFGITSGLIWAARDQCQNVFDACVVGCAFTGPAAPECEAGCGAIETGCLLLRTAEEANALIDLYNCSNAHACV